MLGCLAYKCSETYPDFKQWGKLLMINVWLMPFTRLTSSRYHFVNTLRDWPFSCLRFTSLVEVTSSFRLLAYCFQNRVIAVVKQSTELGGRE